MFPGDHWDHFMRTDAVHRDSRDCIVPDVSRNYNIGEVAGNSQV